MGITYFFWYDRTTDGKLKLYFHTCEDFGFKDIAWVFKWLNNLTIKSLYVKDINGSVQQHSHFDNKPLKIQPGSNPTIPLQLMIKNGWSIVELQKEARKFNCFIERYHLVGSNGIVLHSWFLNDFYLELPLDKEERMLQRLKDSIFEPIIYLANRANPGDFSFFNGTYSVVSRPGVTNLIDYFHNDDYENDKESFYSRLCID
jgi:hypothetical protein